MRPKEQNLSQQAKSIAISRFFVSCSVGEQQVSVVIVVQLYLFLVSI